MGHSGLAPLFWGVVSVGVVRVFNAKNQREEAIVKLHHHMHPLSQAGMRKLLTVLVVTVIMALGMAATALANPIVGHSIKASKALSGDTLHKGQFEFLLIEGSDPAGKVIQTKHNEADGSVTFDEIIYSEVGAYHYVVKEAIPQDATNANVNAGKTTYDKATADQKLAAGWEKDGVTYDTTFYGVTVSVMKDQYVNPGALMVDDAYVRNGTTPWNGAFFKNAIKSMARIEGTKHLKGAKLKDGQFEFVIVDGAGNVLTHGTNKADGTIVFEPFEVARVGTYSIQAYEVIPDDAVNPAVNDGKTAYKDATDTQKATPGWTKDGITYDVSVHDGELAKMVVADSDTYLYKIGFKGELVFNNSYVKPKPSDATLTLTAKKILKGAKLADKQFSFELKDKDGTVVETVTNDVNGDIEFSPLVFTKEGEYKFTVSEVKGTKKGYTYDGTVHECLIKVTKDADGTLVATLVKPADVIEFTNSFKEEPGTPDTPSTPDKPEPPGTPGTPHLLPKTGDAGVAGALVLIALAGLGLVGAGLKKRA